MQSQSASARVGSLMCLCQRLCENWAPAVRTRTTPTRVHLRSPKRLRRRGDRTAPGGGAADTLAKASFSHCTTSPRSYLCNIKAPTQGKIMADERPTDSAELNAARLARVEVEGLFDLFNHRIDLRLEERVTILHGLNGVGKTVILRMIDAFFDGDYMAFRQIPFKVFRLNFVGSGGVTLHRSQLSNDTVMLQIDSSVVGAQGTIMHTLAARHLNRAKAALRAVRGLLERGEDEWHDRRTNRSLTTAAAWESYQHELPPAVRRTGLFDDPPWLLHVRKLRRVHFIETQRLLRYNKRERQRTGVGDGMVHGVVDCAHDLLLRLTRAFQLYGKGTQALDESFPQRLLRGVPPLSIETIRNQLTALNQRQDRLRAIGLLPYADVSQFDRLDLNAMEPIHQAVMTLYLEDSERKLAPFEELQQRVSLLLDNLNRKLNPNKTLTTDLEAGLTLRDRRKAELPLSVLSSGEQHELVLLYDLLFNVPKNGLVLIDEPELSLHVEWQKTFLTDLLSMIEIGHFDVVIATHSPFIIGDRSDLMEGLPTEALITV